MADAIRQALDEDRVLALLRKHFDSKTVKALTYTSWKDGIDLERVSTACMDFAAALSAPSGYEAGIEAAAKAVPRMDGTPLQQAHWRIEALREALNEIGLNRDDWQAKIALNAIAVDEYNRSLSPRPPVEGNQSNAGQEIRRTKQEVIAPVASTGGRRLTSSGTAREAPMKADRPAALDQSPPVDERGSIVALKNSIDIRLNDWLCEMKPDYDDSITGFNEAWDIVRKAFADAVTKENAK